MTISDLWALCVDPERSDFDLSRPFIQSGWRYATDARIVIREPATGEPDSEGKYPSLAEFFKPADCTEPWPEPTGEVRWDRCDDCGESGVVQDVCPDCDGKGTGECPECANVEACRKCKGSGSIPTGKPCPVCKGQKVIARPMQTVDRRWLDARYTQVLYELGATYCPSRWRHNTIAFQVGTIEGRLEWRDKALEREPPVVEATADEPQAAAQAAEEVLSDGT